MSEAIRDLDGLCNCLAARRAARYLTAVYDQALAPTGLRITQFSILYRLARSGPTSVSVLAGHLAMYRTTLATNLKPLTRDRLVRVRAGTDKRERVAEITAAGDAALREAIPLWSQAQEAFEGRYGDRPASVLRKSQNAVLDTGFDPWTH